MHPHVAEVFVGHQLGSYRIERKLGEGGMGAVFLATQLKLDRQVAVKVLPPLLSRDAGLIQRFEREARALAGVESPYIVPIHDLFEAHGMFCIAMGYAAGGSLADLLKRGPLPEERAVELIRQAALGLHEAHVHKGIVHRDIKPDNLLLTASGRVQIADFGLAKAMAESSGLTRSGTLMGTPAFMSPEQFRDSRAVDHRSDLYALGCTLWALLTGAPPFAGPSAANLMHQHLHEPLPSLPPSVSAGLREVLQRLLQKDPTRRYPDAAALAMALAGLRPAASVSFELPVPPPVPPRPPSAPIPRSAAPPPLASAPPPRAVDEALRPRRRSRPVWGPLLLAALLVLLGTGGAWLAWKQPWRARLQLGAFSPESGSLVQRKSLRFSGQVLGDVLPASVEVAQRQVPLAADGTFAHDLALQEGENRIVVRVGALQRTLVFTRDSSEPELRVLRPGADTVIGLAPLEVVVEAADPHLASVSIAGRRQEPGVDGLYRAVVQPGPGSHRIEVLAKDAVGNQRLQTFRLVVDGQGPVLSLRTQQGPGSLLIEVGADEWIERVELDDGQVFAGGQPPLQIELWPEQPAGQLWLTAFDRWGNAGRESVSYLLSEALRGLQACDWWWTPDRQWEIGQALSLPVAVNNSLGQPMVLIPPGQFSMGSSDKDPDHLDGETEHTVVLDVPFYLAATELSQAAWQQVMGGKPESPDMPANNLSWFDAIDFCNRLSQLEGLEAAYLLEDEERDEQGHMVAARVVWLGHARNGYRLPSEAEWEYACKAGGDGTRGPLDDIAWTIDNCAGPELPSQLRANPWGLYDMLGNVWEWCWDGWAAYGTRLRRDPRGPLHDATRIARGGGYLNDASVVRAAKRASEPPSAVLPQVGLRLARSLPQPLSVELLSLEQLVAAEQLGILPSWRESHGRQLVLIPAGDFLGACGSITITRPFAMQRHEVTQDQWWALMGTQPAEFRTAGADAPIENVSWYDALLYCNRLSEAAGIEPFYQLRAISYDDFGSIDQAEVLYQPLSAPGYRLPTEAEWEYACRAGTTGQTWRGDLPAFGADVPMLGEIAWYAGNSGYLGSEGWPRLADTTMEEPAEMLGPQVVGGRPANPWGLYDMLGNVYEWTWDVEGLRPLHPVRDPVGPLRGSQRVVKGGCFYVLASDCTASYRGSLEAATRAGTVGFRPVRTLTRDDPSWSPAFAQLVAANQLEIPVGEQAACGLELALLPAGRYLRGSPVDEPGRDDDEREHQVEISRPFYIGRTEISQEMWLRVMGEAAPGLEEAGATAPMENINWYDALEFCNRLSDHQGLPHAYQLADVVRAPGGGIDGATVTFLGLQSSGYRLPTEAEWEYACRAGSVGPVYQGVFEILAERNAPALDPLAFYSGNSGVPYEGTAAGDWEGRQELFDYAGTQLVAGKLPNAWGLYDMLGNVLEWCFDSYGPYPEGPQRDPYLNAEQGSRIIRGGSYFNPAARCRVATRGLEDPGGRYANVGFRVVRTAP